MKRTLKISTILGRGLAVGALSFCAAGLHASPAWPLDDNALPSGGNVVGGSASFDYSTANELHVHQSSDRAVIDWDSFNVGENALTQFHQNNASSIVVNRVTGSGDPTQILGSLKANGIVMVLDRDGVIFGEGSRVDVGGIVASTGTIDTAAFMDSGSVHLSDIDTGGSVINHGTISVADAGLAAFVAPTVTNNGIITARLGRVHLASGDAATLDLYGDGLVELAVADEKIDRVISNTGILSAEGGTILMTAATAKDVVNSVINLEGIASAASASVKGGKIILGADTITLAETATLDASSTADKGGEVILYANDEAHIAGTIRAAGSSEDNGGFIETSAIDTVDIADTASIDTGGGTWLIDPTNFTIANTGGNITTATLAAQLAANNITIETADAGSDAGDIFVNNALSWTGNKTLTLKAHRNIEVNAAITNTQGGSLVLRADKNGSGTGTVIFGASGSAAMSGGGRTDLYYNPSAYTAPTNFSAKVTGTNTAWMLVNNVTQLQAMNTNLAGSYALGKDIDASDTVNWNAGAGFNPIGNNSTNDQWSRFRGSFDGLGHTITGLTINRPTTDYVGLFGYTGPGTGVLRNVQMDNAQITGKNYVGALVGYNYDLGISNTTTSGTVSGTNYVGGLVGSMRGAISNASSTSDVNAASYVGGLVGYAQDNVTISNSHATGAVTSTGNYVGGLVGQMRNNTTITNSYATGNVSGAGSVGGLLGYAYYNTSTIANSYATGDVSGTGNGVGGLIGYAPGATITDSHATGNVSGKEATGGLIGGIDINIGSSITNSYATGNVIGTNYVGGLLGYVPAGVSSATINNSFAMGSATGVNYVGGLVGYMRGTVNNSYATGAVAGTSHIGGLLGYTYSVTNVSNSYSTGSVTGTSSLGGLIGSNFGTINVSNSYWNTQTSGRATSAGGASAVGLTTAQMKQMSSFSGWNIANTGGAGTIWRIYEGYTAPLLSNFLTPLTVTAADASTTYNGTAFGGGNATYSGFKAGDSAASLLGTLIYGGTSQGAVNAGTYGITLAGGLDSGQQGYDISYAATPATLTIGKRDITATVHNDTRAYGDANPTWDWSDVTWNNLANSEDGSVLDALLLSSEAGAASEGGSYAITLTGFADNNYNLTGYALGKLTVGAKPVLPSDAARIVNAKLSATSTSAPHSDVHLVAKDDAARPTNVSVGCLTAMVGGGCIVR